MTQQRPTSQSATSFLTSLHTLVALLTTTISYTWVVCVDLRLSKPASFLDGPPIDSRFPIVSSLPIILGLLLLLLSTRSLPTTLRLALTCSYCNLKFQLHRGIYLNAPINFTTVLASSAANSATTARCSILRHSSPSHVNTYCRRSTGRLTLAFT